MNQISDIAFCANWNGLIRKKAPLDLVHTAAVWAVRSPTEIAARRCLSGVGANKEHVFTLYLGWSVARCGRTTRNRYSAAAVALDSACSSCGRSVEWPSASHGGSPSPAARIHLIAMQGKATCLPRPPTLVRRVLAIPPTNRFRVKTKSLSHIDGAAAFPRLRPQDRVHKCAAPSIHRKRRLWPVRTTNGRLMKTLVAWLERRSAKRT